MWKLGGEIQEECILAGRRRMWVLKIHGVPRQAVQFLCAMGADLNSISLSVCGTGYREFYVGEIAGERCDLIEKCAHDEPIICKLEREV